MVKHPNISIVYAFSYQKIFLSLRLYVNNISVRSITHKRSIQNLAARPEDGLQNQAHIAQGSIG